MFDTPPLWKTLAALDAESDRRRVNAVALALIQACPAREGHPDEALFALQRIWRLDCTPRARESFLDELDAVVEALRSIGLPLLAAEVSKWSQWLRRVAAESDWVGAPRWVTVPPP